MLYDIKYSLSDSWILSTARKLLKSLSIKQGIKYDSRESAQEIPAFIHFHNLNVEEILDPLSSFSVWPFFFDSFRAIDDNAL
jgi:hypothetical protein